MTVKIGASGFLYFEPLLLNTKTLTFSYIEIQIIIANPTKFKMETIDLT